MRRKTSGMRSSTSSTSSNVGAGSGDDDKKSVHASECGTYTVEAEPHKRAKGGGVVSAGAMGVGENGEEEGEEDEVYVTRKNFVSDWVNQHQITTTEDSKTRQQQGDPHRVSTSSSSPSGTRVRRSLPQIPPSSSSSSPSSHQNATAGKKLDSATTGGAARKSESGDRASSKTPPADDAGPSEGDSPTPVGLVRSGSFTMDKPSSCVDHSDIPTVTSLDTSDHRRLARSGSFTKDSPGISHQLVPKIEKEKPPSNSSRTPVTSSSKTSDQQQPRRSSMNSNSGGRRGDCGGSVRARSTTRTSTNGSQQRSKPWLSHKPATPIPKTLTSDNERSQTPPMTHRNGRRQPPPHQKRSSSSVRASSTIINHRHNSNSNNYSSDCESPSPSALRLTRTTLLRQSKAKNSKPASRGYSSLNTSTTTTTNTTASAANSPSIPRDKKKSGAARSSSDRLNELSKPPMRRMRTSVASGNESSDTEAKAGVRPGRRKTSVDLSKPRSSSNNRSRTTPTTTTPKLLRRANTINNADTSIDTTTTTTTATSLGQHIVRHVTKNSSVNPGRRHVTRASTSVTSESEDESSAAASRHDDIKRRVRERHRAVGLRAYGGGRSSPDGDDDDLIARASNDLVRNLSLLSTSVDRTTTTNTDEGDETTTLVEAPSQADSLDVDGFEATTVMEERARKRWKSEVGALDSLMLSNVCALSVRLCAIADGLTGKIALLHARSAPYDPSKSQVPLLQQTSSQEMATLVNNLRHVESQLLRADRILDPSHKLRDIMHD